MEVKFSHHWPHDPMEVVFWVKLSSRCLQREPRHNETLPTSICVLEGTMMLISVQIKQ